ncbi:hypothetical protein [Dactylococcopsis salina]|uniref:hypothetical protein n=1 Tax=Dactylococcopsis salina TaxID=292566 RepID=UPI0002D8300B|nr:hypothetical protein [Dactylococcopsis salina]
MEVTKPNTNIRYLLFVIRYSLFVIRYLLFVICYSLFVIRYSLFVHWETFHDQSLCDFFCEKSLH